MKVFVGVNSPLQIKEEIVLIQQQLERLEIKARWVKPEVAHLTVVFLGSIKENHVKTVETILADSTRKVSQISLTLSKVEAFPNLRRATTVILSLDGEIKRLEGLTQKIREGLKAKGLPFDTKPFIPHLTLGRLRKRQNLTEIAAKIKIKSAKFVFKELILFESKTFTEGPEYRKINTFPLC